MNPELKSKPIKPAEPGRAKVSKPRPAWSDAQILAAADICIQRTPPPAGYGFALGLMASALIFIPVMYLALVGFLAWLFIWHTGQTFSSLSTGPLFLFHVPMAILGGVLIVFLVKPVFFRRKVEDDGVVTLTRETQPLLFAFVDKTCAAVGVRPPAVIEVDCEVNAHVGMRRGVLSVVAGDLVLRIGLPLVAAFSLQQLAGVLAHEFGHFNQLAGRNSSYLIRRLTVFFAKVVFQRDKLDAWLLRIKSRRSVGRQVIYYVVAGPVESVRGLLWLMLISSELLTRRVLRHMEYDADVVGAKVSGVEDFIRVSKLLAFLGIASQRARQDLAGALDHLRLADDLPRLIVASAKQLVEHRTDILASLEKETTGWFDTHPCYADRIRNVRQTEAVALLVCNEPARRLFSNFDQLCKSTTQSFYQAVIGEKMAGVKLVPAGELATETAGQRLTMKALRRYFQDQVVLSRPIIPGTAADTPFENPKDAIALLRASRAAMVTAAVQLGDLSDRFSASEIHLRSANATVDLCNLFPGNPRIFPVRLRGVKDQNHHEQILRNGRNQLMGFEQVAIDRLTIALRLLRDKRIAAKLAPVNGAGGDMAKPGFAGLLLGVLRELQPFIPAVARLRQQMTYLRVHLSACNPKRPYPPLTKKIVGMSGDIVRKLTRLKVDLGTLPYPFEHGLEIGAVGDVVVQELPDANNPVEACVSAARVIARFDVLMVRVIGSLSEWAERVETAVGLECLTDPPDREDTRESERQAVERRNTRRYWLHYSIRAVGGVTMLLSLVWLSVSPPSMSGWGDQSGVIYRPAAFTAQAAFEPARPQIRMPGTGWITAEPNMDILRQLQSSISTPHPWVPSHVPMQHSWQPAPGISTPPGWKPARLQPPQPVFPSHPQFTPPPFPQGGRGGPPGRSR